jgi:DNA adenine methylase
MANIHPRKHRPLIRYHGGKWKIALWVLSFINAMRHRIYTEAFGGGASVLIRKPAMRNVGEIYNDLDDTLVHLFRTLQDPAKAAALVRAIELTPFARSEFDLAYELCDDDVERARRTLIRSFMGFGSDGTTGEYKTGFRRNVTSNMKLPAQEWVSYPSALQLIVQRLKSVVIEQTDAFDLLLETDNVETLHYVDPPYLPSTRSQGNRRRGAGFHVYRHEMTEEQHVQLLALLRSLTGMVVLSGYPSELYDDTLAGWERVTRDAHADGGRPRVEVLWFNPAAMERLREGARLC